MLLAGTLPLGWGGTGPMPQSIGDVRPPLYKVIFDTRFQAARSYAAAAAREGLLVAAFDGDPTALWLRDLGPHWAGGGAAVAGMTTERTLLCLEQMAHGVWRRVRAREYCAIWDRPRDTPLVSWIIDS